MEKILTVIKVVFKKIKHFLKKSKDIIFKLFEFSLIVKGVDGVLEIIGSAILFYVSKPDKIDQIVLFLTQHELSQDPDDYFANLIYSYGQKISVGATLFGAIYLLSHGIVKIFLVTMLLKKKIWAYPVVAISLLAFAGYQVYRFTHTHNPALVFFSVFDVFTAGLTYLVYKDLKKQV